MEALPEQLPKDHKNLRVSLGGYALMMGEGIAQSRQVMPIDIYFSAPTRGGVFKDKKQTMNMMANYCMFCGVKYDKDEPVAA
ncbi:hypothetical protein [Pseudomonas sp. BF-B-25]|uniref:hypothetical protein n=1 Tax=Pseudomonas sp. BF-B-25 TaxID=2832355 RepID=UPI001CBFE7AE|nr:hypothetical protein [Pseudomonas sp. BF-B-25]